jgi:tetratricopeptide (TPR) repeat protein
VTDQPDEPVAPASPTGEGVDDQVEGPDVPSATEPAELADEGADPGRPVELRLARLHLRTGAFALARAELEAAAGAAILDRPALLDLAEIRWRTGDLAGAGEAADAYLAMGGSDPLAFVIAAEAAAGEGRANDAYRHSAEALRRLRRPLDAVFAGLPRSAVWPGVGGSLPTARGAPTLFGDPVPAASPAGPLPPAMGTPPSEKVGASGPGAPAGPGAPSAEVGPSRPGAPAGPGAPSAEVGPFAFPPSTNLAASTAVGLPAGEALARGRQALAEGRPGDGAFWLGLALRLDPALAPTVVHLTEGGRDPQLALVRGDAQRLLGDEEEARRSFALALRLASSAASPAPRPAAGPPNQPTSAGTDGLGP